MDLKMIYVIEGDGFCTDDIVEIIKEEEYTHNFYFASKHPFNKGYLMQCDEVWCFGDCELVEDYHMAMESRKDIWQMG